MKTREAGETKRKGWEQVQRDKERNRGRGDDDLLGKEVIIRETKPCNWRIDAGTAIKEGTVG